MTTFDTLGNLLDDAPRAGLPAHVDAITKLAGVHRVLSGLQPSRANLFAALGLVALVGAAYWLEARDAEPVFELVDDDETDEGTEP